MVGINKRSGGHELAEKIVLKGPCSAEGAYAGREAGTGLPAVVLQQQ